MTLLEDAATEQIVNDFESLYDSVNIHSVVQPTDANVKEQELRVFWRLMDEGHRLAREPLTYRIMAQVAEWADDLEVMLIHTDSPALRRRLRYRLHLYAAWRKYNNRPWPATVRPMDDPIDVLFNRAGTDD